LLSRCSWRWRCARRRASRRCSAPWAWALISWLISPEIAGEWSRFTGYFAPRKAAYDLPEMQKFLAEHPDAKIALDQLKFAVP
jgi:sn-glycerol 3-phosphate transport system substrate-binding protein